MSRTGKLSARRRKLAWARYLGFYTYIAAVFRVPQKRKAWKREYITHWSRSPGIHVELTHLAEIYAIQVRELSDAVATLGRKIAAEEQIGQDIAEVKRLRILAEQAGEELLAAIESLEARALAASQRG